MLNLQRSQNDKMNLVIPNYHIILQDQDKTNHVHALLRNLLGLGLVFGLGLEVHSAGAKISLAHVLVLVVVI